MGGGSGGSVGGDCVARYSFLLSSAVLCTLAFVVAFQSREIVGAGEVKDGLASYLNPIVKNAYRPFGWGVDEAVEALEESARASGEGAGIEANQPHALPPEEEEGDGAGDGEKTEQEEKEEEEEEEGEEKQAGGRVDTAASGGSTKDGARDSVDVVEPTTAATAGAEVDDPEEAAIANGVWHQHGTKRKLNRLPGVKEPLYPACYPPSERSPPGPDATLEEDLEYMIERVESAPSFDFPFRSYTYFCDIWPPHLWESLHALFPPTSVFDRLERNVKRQVRGTGGARKSPYQRYQLNAQEIAGRKRSWRSAAQAAVAWTRALNLLYHPRFEAAVWRKFSLTRKPRSREARILVDKDGKAVGRIHPDTTYKILTMQFYFPVSNASFWDYGTCVHTRQQQARRDVKKDEEGDCWGKFIYQPNSGYSFYISRNSYHSSPNSRVVHNGDRRTMLVNWYHT